MHEIAPDVTIHGITRDGVIVALLADMPLQTLHAKMRATAFYAAVSVVDKGPFINRVRVIVIKVMNNPVDKLGCEHLAFLGIGDDETR